MGSLEQGVGFFHGLRSVGRHINLSNVSMGIFALVFSWTGVLFLVGNAANAGFNVEQSVSWVFGAYIVSGIVGIYMSLTYQSPIAGAWSVPGATLVGASAAMTHFTINEVTGAFLSAGLIVFLLGITGVVKRLLNLIPQPIIMAMVAGVLMRFGIGIVTNIEKMPLVGGAVVLVYLLSLRFLKKVPPILSAIIVVAIYSVVTASAEIAADSALTMPQIYLPHFSLSAIVSIGIPLAILVVGAENAQAIGVLKANRYEAPITAMTVVSGVGGAVASLFCGHSANIAGPVTAICAGESAGPKEGRYIASLIFGIGNLFIFGLMAPIIVKLTLGISPGLLYLLLGLVMIGVINSSLKEAFTTNKFSLGVFTSLVVAMSNLNIYNISSPFWALVFGLIVSLIAEKDDFATELQID
jgi:benzoate membrane transport protein